jgi:hypothetical protein
MLFRDLLTLRRGLNIKIKKYGGVEVWLHTFLTSAVGGGKW